MKNIFQKASLLAATILVLPLAGCGDGKLAQLNPFEQDVVDVQCPPLGSLKEAETLTRFQPGDGRDLTDVVIDARVGRVVGKCEVRKSELLADVTAGVELLAERGPALTGDTAPIEYFIAIQAPDGSVAGRQGFTLDFEFEDGARQARAVDYLTFQLPNATPEALPRYRIFVGLQMTESEWSFSRRTQRER